MVYPEKRPGSAKSPQEDSQAPARSPFSLRGYRPGDWKPMYALDIICFDPPFRFSQKEMRRLAEQPDAICLLAEVERELAGFCIVHREGKWAYIVTLDVGPQWRRLGLATRLLAEIETEIRSEGGAGIALHVHNRNAGAIRFYEFLGYARAGIAENFYGSGLDALVYRKTW